MEDHSFIVDKKILIIDGDGVSLFLYKEILGEYTSNIYQAQSQKEAENIIRFLKNNRIAIDVAFISDWVPGALSSDLCRLVRGASSSEAKIILVTTNDQHKLEDAKKDGFDCLLPMPMSFKDFLKATLKPLMTFYQ